MANKPLVRMEFHISRVARDRYQFDEVIYTSSGNAIFPDFRAARVFSQKMNALRDLVSHPEQTVHAGQINAMGLIDEILHMVVQLYREQRLADVMAQALDWLNEKIGQAGVETALRQFAVEFPPVAVYRGEVDLDEYLEGESQRADGQSVPNRQIVLEEMLLLWLANANPGFTPYKELFDDSSLKKNSDYLRIVDSLHGFFDTRPTFGPDNQNLIDMLRSPALAFPHSLSAQLEYIRTRWSALVGRYLSRLLRSLDLIKEEEKVSFLGPGPSRVYEFADLEYEIERFSPDKEWMPNLVLIAKNTYVWLDQLSKKYGRAIVRLDHIPDEELDTLARWGFTGLWLIGLWERSQASRIIKQMRGNPDAVASAYSLFYYDIAEDLGGEAAYQDLRERAWRRGIRLASDMVPNHMGIDSRWVIEHPDWFISLDYSPFPSYTYNGRNLSWDERVGIYLEDHYYDGTDAAVVFKRVDFWTGAEKYIYHGNDGTSMPWNDTAQLNYLIPEVREAVIQTILHVARKFPVIRFDAAMTLAKRHYERLWFPEPGSGGDIPSRAEHGLTKEQFEEAFPEEFWRMVVDRVAQEVPDTLLLAEAFWLMEGYFVRSLGMHRVYNSAFMNMLRDEKNKEYRLVIKNTVEFDPEILKRYVNFMNNPDERTAVDQFGKGDKYFGICTLMATMPGLPMFGHGQIEGFTEKYGMEFKKPMWDETPDAYLVERHAREIFPLLRRRYLFAEVRNFLLYDFYMPDGQVNEDVFAYSNRAGEQRALVIYHNKFASAKGWIRLSAAYPVKKDGDERALVQTRLGDGLALQDRQDYFTIFRDHVTGLEYIRNNHELHQNGLFVELDAYKYHVFLGFYQVQDDGAGRYAELAQLLQGRGVPSIEETLKEHQLRSILEPYRQLVNAGMFEWLIENRAGPNFDSQQYEQAIEEAEEKLKAVLVEVLRMTGGERDVTDVTDVITGELRALLSLPGLQYKDLSKGSTSKKLSKQALEFVQSGSDGRVDLAVGDPGVWGVLLAWLFTNRLADVSPASDPAEQSRAWIDEWLLRKSILSCLMDLGLDEATAQRSLGLARVLTSQRAWYDEISLSEDKSRTAQTGGPVSRLLETWLSDDEVQRYLLVNRYKGELWFNKEAYEELVWWLYLIAIIRVSARIGLDAGAGKSVFQQGLRREVERCFKIILALMEAEENSGFQVEKLLGTAKE